MADIRRRLAAEAGKVLEIAREQGIKFDAGFWVIVVSLAGIAVILVYIPWNH